MQFNRHMLYSDRNREAAEVYDALGDLIYQDMRDGNGVHWWTGLEVPRNLLIADYLTGLTESLQANLDQASMHLARTSELSTRVDVDTRLRIGRNERAGVDPLAGQSPKMKNEMLELQGHLAGFLRAVGSVLDNVGGIVVGTTGMNVDIVRASWDEIAKWSAEGRHTKRKRGLAEAHLDLVDRYITAVEMAIDRGPSDWIDWTMDYRNTVVHRAARTCFSVYNPKRLDFAHPLPKHPDHTHAESMVRGRSLADELMGRDLKLTLELIFTSALEVAVDVGKASIQMWLDRQATDACQLQPAGQWAKYARGRDSNFEGAGESFTIRSKSMHISPRSARRLKVARLLDHDVNAWRHWMRDELREPKP